MSTLRRIALAAFLLLFALLVLRLISLERLRLSLLRTGSALPSPTPVLPLPSSTPAPTASATPKPIVVTGRLETARLFSGITLHSNVETLPGAAASEERVDPQSYALDLKLQVRVPTANRTLEELAKVNAQLPRLLPGLAAMLNPNAVSPLFADLYNAKVKSLRENLTRLDQLLSRHNFYDCQTILDLRGPQNARRAVLLQADMDVDADGSDSDRLPNVDGSSATFKPFTSYKWPKKTPVPNTFLAPTEEKLKRYEAEFALKGLPPERNRDLRLGIVQMRDEIETLKRYSFLIGATDPYIVLPGGLGHGENSLGRVGDYAIVISGDKLYPAIVGDIGPGDKVGEASLRIAKEINPLASPNNRPVSELKVSYVIFPGTAETPWGPPDLPKIEARCAALLGEIGGAGVPLHHWENLIPPPPTPTPTPTPVPPPPSPSSSPAVSPSPGSSLIPTTSPLVRPSP